MSNSLRSKQGCWTCRLRKKKCDEVRPHCSTCASLSITCYGFGTRPDWMNGGKEEKLIASGIKDIVKRTSRRGTASRENPKTSTSIVTLAPKLSDESSKSSTQSPRPDLVSGTDSNLGLALPRGPTNQADSNVFAMNPEPMDLHPPNHDDPAASGITLPISMDDSILLMHFLDNVFPLQYPIYNPDILAGGRGWLMANLLQSKPLYYAVLAIASYHRRMIVVAKLDQPHQIAALIQQEKHLEVCLSLVKDYAQNSCHPNGLGIATCIVQLLFYELFNGHLDAWQPHLRAAIIMYERAQEKDFGRLGLSETSRIIICEDRTVVEFDSVVSTEVANFRFLVGTMIWLDILSSITTGTAPSLAANHSHTISPNSQIKLEQIMGCENWAMSIIGRISILHEHKIKVLELQGTITCSEFERALNDTSEEIHQHLARTSVEDLNFSELQANKATTFITHVFTSCALIYLHLITFGFQKMELLNRACVSDTLLHGLVPSNVAPALICPLFVIGAAAKEEDKLFFRSFFSSPALLHPALQHRTRILPVLEEIWRRRRVSTNLTWMECVGLTSGLLLV